MKKLAIISFFILLVLWVLGPNDVEPLFEENIPIQKFELQESSKPKHNKENKIQKEINESEPAKSVEEKNQENEQEIRIIKQKISKNQVLLKNQLAYISHLSALKTNKELALDALEDINNYKDKLEPMKEMTASLYVKKEFEEEKNYPLEKSELISYLDEYKDFVFTHPLTIEYIHNHIDEKSYEHGTFEEKLDIIHFALDAVSRHLDKGYDNYINQIDDIKEDISHMPKSADDVISEMKELRDEQESLVNEINSLRGNNNYIKLDDIVHTNHSFD